MFGKPFRGPFPGPVWEIPVNIKTRRIFRLTLALTAVVYGLVKRV